jgi:hypothetical protein
MPRRKRISSPSISARGTTGRRRARAATSSGLSLRIALDTTTTSTARHAAASWPRSTRMPSSARRRVTPVSDWSEPLTA